MANKNFSSKTKKIKVGVQHWLVTLTVAIALFAGIFYTVIPVGIAGGVVPLFKPTAEQQLRVGFVKFNGLVWGSTSKEKEADSSRRDSLAGKSI